MRHGLGSAGQNLALRLVKESDIEHVLSPERYRKREISSLPCSPSPVYCVLVKRGRKSVRIGRGSAAVTGYDLPIGHLGTDPGEGGGKRHDAGSQKTLLFTLVMRRPDVPRLVPRVKE